MARKTILDAMASQRFADAETLASALFDRYPGFAPAGNNLVDTLFAQGRLDESLAVARRVLDRHPENAYALANMAARLCPLGRWEEARGFAERLRRLTKKPADVWVRQQEVFNYFGDDEAVLDAWREAEKMADLADTSAFAFGQHLAAVACMRLDRLDEARHLWNKALDLKPDLSLARENLDDCWKPVSDREGPWPFELSRWLKYTEFDNLYDEVSNSGRDTSESIADIERRWLAERPHLEALIPTWLDRGPPEARKFALSLATTADTPAMRQALEAFMRGKRGSDRQRFNAGLHLAKVGALESREVRMWINGEWRDTFFKDYELHGESSSLCDPKADELACKAHEALREGKAKRAEELLMQAIELVLDKPSLQQNLANAYVMQGREDEAIELSKWTRQRFPDYLFGRVQAAYRYISSGELDFAEAELAPFRESRRLHFSEFSALANAEVRLCHARRDDDAARSWLNFWEGLVPDDPQLRAARNLVEGTAGFSW